MKYEIETNEKWSILNALTGIILKYKPGCIIEIGTSYGDVVRDKRKSTTILGDHAKLFNQNFYTCDIRKQVVIDYAKHKHFAMSSFDFIKGFDEYVNEPPSVVFLDGCHNYDVVIQEVKFFFNVLNTGGFIFMHDTMPRTDKSLAGGACSDSYRVRQEVEKWTEIADCLTLPYTAGNNGLTMLIKKEENRIYYRK